MNSILLEDLQYIIDRDLNWEQFKNKTVLITGATGFLATYIIDTLIYLNKIRQYNITIIGISRNIEKAKMKFSKEFYNGLNILYHDIENYVDIEENIDYIIHSASSSTPKFFKTNPVETILPNVIGTNNLLKLAVEKKVKQFIFFSTSGVYGEFIDGQDYFDENLYPIKEYTFGSLDPMNISSCYLESKRSGENLCVAYYKQYGVPIKVIRPSIIYGYGLKLNDGRVLSDFIYNIINKQDIVLKSQGQDYRSFCYISDFIFGVFTVILKGKIGEAYNISSEEEYKILDFAELLTDNFFSNLNLKVILKEKESLNYSRINFSSTLVDVSKLKSLGWHWRYNIETGIKRTIQAYKESYNE